MIRRDNRKVQSDPPESTDWQQRFLQQHQLLQLLYLRQSQCKPLNQQLKRILVSNQSKARLMDKSYSQYMVCNLYRQ